MVRSVFHVTDKIVLRFAPAEKITGEAVCTCRQRSCHPDARLEAKPLVHRVGYTCV